MSNEKRGESSMPWRLIVFIFIFAIFLVFIVFNLENKCDISFGPITVFPQVPVFITIFTSFFLGLLCSLPLVLFTNRRRKEKADKKDNKDKLKDKIRELDEASPRGQGDIHD